MRIYISGPMTGKAKLNIDAFDKAVVRLSNAGHFPINPHDISSQFGTKDELAASFDCLYKGKSQIGDATPALARAVLDADLAAVRACDAIYLLRGWEESRGARLELAEALKNGLQIMLEEDER